MILKPYNRAERVLYAAYNGRTTKVFEVNMAELEIQEFPIKNLSNKRLPPGHQIMQMPDVASDKLDSSLRQPGRYKNSSETILVSGGMGQTRKFYEFEFKGQNFEEMER